MVGLRFQGFMQDKSRILHYCYTGYTKKLHKNILLHILFLNIHAVRTMHMPNFAEPANILSFVQQNKDHKDNRVMCSAIMKSDS